MYNKNKRVVKFNSLSRNQIFFKHRVYRAIIAVFCTALWGNMMPMVMVGFNVFGIEEYDINSKIFFAGLCFVFAGLAIILFSKLNKTNFQKSPVLKVARGSKLKILKVEITKTNFPILVDIFMVSIVQTSFQYIFLYVGLSHTSGFNASIISSSGTFIIIILSHFIYKNDKMDLLKVIGCVFGAIGVLVLNFNQIGEFKSNFTFKGEGFIFLATLTYVLMTPICKRACKICDASLFTGYTFIIGAIPLIIWGLVCGANIAINIPGILVLCVIVFEASAAGVLWNILLEYNKVSSISIYNLLVPIFGALSSQIMLNEYIFGMHNLLSLLFTCLGIYLVESDHQNCSKR